MENKEEMAQEVEQTQEVVEVVETRAAVQTEEFDWDAYESDAVVATSERKNLEDIYDQTLSSITENEVVDGTVVGMNKREVLINIGYKSEGVVNMNEFRYNPELKLGDTVEVYGNPRRPRWSIIIITQKSTLVTFVGSCKPSA